ncbi:MAG: hypothetical protein WA970_06295, partial [Gammaproteobacteria bacterium]
CGSGPHMIAIALASAMSRLRIGADAADLGIKLRIGPNPVVPLQALRSGSCTRLYTAVVTRPIPGARPVGASLWLFKIVPDDFVATVRLALPALATFLP